MSEPIVRIAARGEGVTASGRHVAFAVPGDMLARRRDDRRPVPATSSRHAVTFPNAAAASCSMSPTRPIAII